MSNKSCGAVQLYMFWLNEFFSLYCKCGREILNTFRDVSNARLKTSKWVKAKFLNEICMSTNFVMMETNNAQRCFCHFYVWKTVPVNKAPGKQLKSSVHAIFCHHTGWLSYNENGNSILKHTCHSYAWCRYSRNDTFYSLFTGIVHVPHRHFVVIGFRFWWFLLMFFVHSNARRQRKRGGTRYMFEKEEFAWFVSM